MACAFEYNANPSYHGFIHNAELIGNVGYGSFNTTIQKPTTCANGEGAVKVHGNSPAFGYGLPSMVHFSLALAADAWLSPAVTRRGVAWHR